MYNNNIQHQDWFKNKEDDRVYEDYQKEKCIKTKEGNSLIQSCLSKNNLFFVVIFLYGILFLLSTSRFIIYFPYFSQIKYIHNVNYYGKLLLYFEIIIYPIIDLLFCLITIKLYISLYNSIKYGFKETKFKFYTLILFLICSLLFYFLSSLINILYLDGLNLVLFFLLSVSYFVINILILLFFINIYIIIKNNIINNNNYNLYLICSIFIFLLSLFTIVYNFINMYILLSDMFLFNETSLKHFILFVSPFATSLISCIIYILFGVIILNFAKTIKSLKE